MLTRPTKKGDEFEYRGLLYRVVDVQQMSPSIINYECLRVNRKTGSTFGKAKNIPFRKEEV